MTIATTFVILALIIFFLSHRRGSWNFFSVVGSLIYAVIGSFLLIVLYRYADGHGFIPRDLRSIVSDTANQIERSGHQAQQNRVY